MCGIAGVFGHKEASNLVYLMLYALQHRGQESAGIVSANYDSEHFFSHRGMGLVSDVFTENIIRKLAGDIGLGHTRYSTTGDSLEKNMQPILGENFKGPIAISHNGNLVNAHELKRELEEQGSLFHSSSDSEVILHLIARSKKERLVERVMEALGQIRGSYSLLVMTDKALIVARDSYGIRPLALGKLDGALVVASETCAFDLIEAEYLRDIEPGEIFSIEGGRQRSFFLPKAQPAHCIFELIYFARPDSFVFGEDVYQFRKRLGQELARDDNQEAGTVFPVPDSSNVAWLGYHEARNEIPIDLGIIRNHYVGRTFIEPKEQIRHFGVRVKLNVARSAVRGKSVIVLDDSIVRSTTGRKIILMLKNAGAKDIHFRSSCPKITDCCYFGIDIPNRDELIANRFDDEEIRQQLGADTLLYQSLSGLRRAVGEKADNFCYACLGGSDYPMEIPEYLRKSGKCL
jgi:amidophosphoribosyltransferase